jgi:LysM repeat protein
MMNKIDNSGQGLAKLGRDEDQYMAHVAQGEMVVPPIISPETRARIEAEMKAVGLSPDEYTVGENMSINPITGMPEFGWLKKTFKSVKKVVKKVAPIATLIPGVGTALGGVLGGIGGLATKIPGIGGALGKIGTAAMKGIGSLGIPGVSSIAGGTAGGFGGIKAALTTKAGLFGGGPLAGIMGVGGSAPVTVKSGDTLTKIANDAGVSVQDLIKANPQITNPNLIQAGMKINIPGSGGFLSNILGPGQGSIADYDPTTGQGQSRLGLIEDLIKGTGGKVREGLGGLVGGSQQPGGGMFGGNMGAAAMAGLLGKAAYDAAKERKGGLAATPAVMMDELGRYQLSKELGTGGTRGEFGLGPAPKALEFAGGGLASTRQYFNMGGVAELDMRDGGESAGPGTGTSDDIPAMLSDGEYVMTAKATRGAGAFNVKKNKSGIELVSGGKPSRKKGVENMRQLMDIFEAI